MGGRPHWWSIWPGSPSRTADPGPRPPIMQGRGDGGAGYPGISSPLRRRPGIAVRCDVEERTERSDRSPVEPSGLDIPRKRAANGQALLVLMSPAAVEALDNISSLRILDSSKVIRQAANFFQLAAKTKRLEAILDRVPTAIDMELLASTNSKILKATRLESSQGGRGRLGRFPTRRYVPDSRQCYRCLRFGHIALACVAESPRCDHCAGPHESRVCWAKRWAKATMPERRCANCEGKQVASSS